MVRQRLDGKPLSTLLALGIVATMFLSPVAADETTPVADKSERAPSLVFSETEHDFGEMKQKQSAKHIFRFKNEGNALLVIDKVKATCGCTGTLLSKDEIQPGEEGEINVTFKTGMSSGKKKKQIYVYSNDPSRPAAKLQIMANIVVPLEMRPRSVRWLADKDRPSTRTVELRYQPDLNIKILKVESSSPAFKVTVQPKNEGDTPAYEIEIQCDGNLPVGNLSEMITITTDNPDYRTQTVAIRGKIVGLIRVVPNSITLGVVKDDLLPSRAVRVFARDNEGFEITEVESTSPLIATELTKNKAANTYKLKVTLTAKPPVGGFSEKLYIKTNTEAESPVEIAVYAYVQ
ncbi:MAG: DUF1573 domain-containing protein [Candidatus Abyssubacteria bacterium]|nr:DUF1573 domain-containing protein [Candidatus Abyssubacteria bacterium]